MGSRATVRTGLPILRGCLSCCLFQEATGQPSSITLYLWCRSLVVSSANCAGLALRSPVGDPVSLLLPVSAPRSLGWALRCSFTRWPGSLLTQPPPRCTHACWRDHCTFQYTDGGLGVAGLRPLGPERWTEASWAIAVGAVLRAALLERPGGRREAESPVEQGLGRWGQVVAQVTSRSEQVCGVGLGSMVWVMTSLSSCRS